MGHPPSLLKYLFGLLALLSTSEGFLWLSSRSPVTERSGMHIPNAHMPQHAWSYRDYPPPQYAYDNTPVPPMTVAALPFALPFSAQMMPVSSLKEGKGFEPLRLVPCLCPAPREDQYQQQQQHHQQQQQQQQGQPAQGQQSAYIVQPTPST